MLLPGQPSSPSRIVPSALDLIGRTPLVALDRVYPGPGRILAKAEFMQPGGSVKDRAARAILLAARADGRLAPGAAVVEMTSGNMGAGLAVACAVPGAPSGRHHVRRQQPTARADAGSVGCGSLVGSPGRWRARPSDRLGRERGGRGGPAHRGGTRRLLRQPVSRAGVRAGASRKHWPGNLGAVR